MHFDRTVLDVAATAGMPYFYGLEAKWFSLDRLFKIFLLPDGIAGAWIAGQVYDEASGNSQVIAPAGLLGPLLAIWVDRIVRKRYEREASYELLAPGSPEFLAVDRRNFVLRATDILRVNVRPKRSLWTGGSPNSGKVQFHLWSGARRTFILIGQHDIATIERLLSDALGPRLIEGIGNASR